MSDPDLKVVPLREGKPSLTDIPALLRNLADEIERGDEAAETMFIVIPQDDGQYPKLRGWGRVDNDRHPIVQLALLQHWLVSRRTERGA